MSLHLGAEFNAMRSYSKRLISSLILCLSLLTWSFAAADPAFTHKLPMDSELILLNGEETYRTGQFLGSWRNVLFLKTFDSGQRRFQTEQIAFDQITEIHWIQHHQTLAYPIGLGLVLGGLSALVGYNSVNTRQIGTLEYPDQRGQAALVFGLIGFAVGSLVGAGVAPERRTETTVWSRN